MISRQLILFFLFLHCSHLLLKVTVNRLIRISYGDYRLEDIPRGLALEVPYKPVEAQKAKGSWGRDGNRRKSKKDETEATAPQVQWITIQ